MSERDAVRQALWNEMERIGGGWNADNMARVAIAALDAYRAGLAATPGPAVTVDDVCHLVWLGMAGDAESVELYARKIAYRLRNDDSGLTQRLAEMLGPGNMLRDAATPGPATVSEADIARLRGIAHEWATFFAPYVKDDHQWYGFPPMDGKDAAAIGEDMQEILMILAAASGRPMCLECGGVAEFCKVCGGQSIWRAARTTARAPEPTEAEIEAGAIALHDFTQEPSGQDRPWENFPDEYQQLFRERARVVLIAARNAGEGGAE